MDVPHLVDIWGEGEAEGITGNRFACLEPRRTECKVQFNFVFVVTVNLGV